jgi:hypothetical protein
MTRISKGLYYYDDKKGFTKIDNYGDLLNIHQNHPERDTTASSFKAVVKPAIVRRLDCELYLLMKLGDEPKPISELSPQYYHSSI